MNHKEQSGVVESCLVVVLDGVVLLGSLLQKLSVRLPFSLVGILGDAAAGAAGAAGAAAAIAGAEFSKHFGFTWASLIC